MARTSSGFFRWFIAFGGALVVLFALLILDWNTTYGWSTWVFRATHRVFNSQSALYDPVLHIEVGFKVGQLGTESVMLDDLRKCVKAFSLSDLDGISGECRAYNSEEEYQRHCISGRGSSNNGFIYFKKCQRVEIHIL